eukprot:m.180026 g.180026  ORF g.180026 m.180026 type:complete len:118 (+) comp39237_c0_seq21:2260-2613(+)
MSTSFQGTDVFNVYLLLYGNCLFHPIRVWHYFVTPVSATSVMVSVLFSGVRSHEALQSHLEGESLKAKAVGVVRQCSKKEARIDPFCSHSVQLQTTYNLIFVNQDDPECCNRLLCQI